jgi:hypothetical protein
MTAIEQLPARIAAKILSITCKATLARIREARLARKTANYTIHIRRHHIFLACIDRRIQLTSRLDGRVGASNKG